MRSRSFATAVMSNLGIKPLIVVVFVALLVVPSQASAHTHRYRIFPVISERSGVDPATGEYDFVGGSVDSRRPRCEEGRVVSLHSTTRGLLATARSDGLGHGDWRIDRSSTLSLPHTDVYFITVPRLVFRSDSSHRHICKAGRSPNMRYR
jgi:hypothetical protein